MNDDNLPRTATEWLSFLKKKDEKDKLYFVFIVCLFEKCTRTISMLKKKK